MLPPVMIFSGSKNRLLGDLRKGYNMIHVNQAPQPNTMEPFFIYCNIRPSLRRSVDSNVVSEIISL